MRRRVRCAGPDLSLLSKFPDPHKERGHEFHHHYAKLPDVRLYCAPVGGGEGPAGHGRGSFVDLRAQLLLQRHGGADAERRVDGCGTGRAVRWAVLVRSRAPVEEEHGGLDGLGGLLLLLLLLLAEVALHGAAETCGVLHLSGALDGHGTNRQSVQVVVDEDGLGLLLEQLLLGSLHELLLHVPVAALPVVPIPEDPRVAVAAAAAAIAAQMMGRLLRLLMLLLLEETRVGPAHQSRADWVVPVASR